ncbi:hypothetical protein [cf. Phormidesmis sp. LEGE 11477]|uniref:hypothetical protein n=1 Tax=cf. Phormidesmis sp. LEGE 11477 TaxID=1828680 RepID=UPI001881F214|nr:hypothetical protein [cf. Phormidesmis sp. LEGE 11477]MBE9060032.1 hypothetical protein [cf. Phormidesmis sp. LEGE 11477]
MKYLRSKYFYGWIAATTLSLFLVNFLLQPDTYAVSPSSIAFVLVYLLTGLIVGVCQWFILRLYFERAYWWIVLTAVGEIPFYLFRQGYFLFLFYTVGESDSLMRFYVGLLAFVGALFPGIFQWLFFRRRVRRAWMWIVASAIAELWIPRLIGMYLIQGTSILLLEMSHARFLLAITVTGIILGVITGIPVADFINQVRQPGVNNEVDR